MTDRVGTRLRGKWTLEALLGTGRTGAVFRARHDIGRHEAIKIMSPELAGDPALRRRFVEEAHAVNRMSHSAIAGIRDIDVTDDGLPLLVMDLIEGEPAAECVRREGMTTAVRLTEELLDALATAHRAGVVHGDLRPEKLVVRSDGSLVILGFGALRAAPRSDAGALGATLFELVTGAAPAEPAPSLASVAPEAPPWLCRIVDGALGRGYDSVEAMRAEIPSAKKASKAPASRKAHAPTDDTLVSAGPGPSRRRAWSRLIGGGALVVFASWLGAGAIVLGMRRVVHWHSLFIASTLALAALAGGVYVLRAGVIGLRNQRTRPATD